jgi:hypothetical protein
MTPLGRRTASAMFKASSTSWLTNVVAIDQPTIRRLQASSTTARYRNPAHVGMWVLSATHNRSGAGAVNLRQVRRLTVATLDCCGNELAPAHTGKTRL